MRIFRAYMENPRCISISITATKCRQLQYNLPLCPTLPKYSGDQTTIPNDEIKLLSMDDAMSEEIIKLKAEIFDIIRQQEAYIIMANNLQQKRLEKIKEIRYAEQNGNTDEILKLKSYTYDIITQQEAYIDAANDSQQKKIKKLQILIDIEEKDQLPVQLSEQAKPSEQIHNIAQN